MTWNTGMDGLRTKPATFKRVLHAIDPDVILFQELTEADHPLQIEAFLGAWIEAKAGKRWTVLRGTGGGQLRTAVAARLKIDPYDALDPLPMPDRPDRSIRITGGEVMLSGNRLLVVSAHLRCCGYAGSFEDRTRMVEADAIRRAIADAVASGRFDGVIFGGDLNRVGSRWPLDILAEDLQLVEPIQIGGRSNTSWSDVRQPFLPGRLDFVLVTDASLTVQRSFVLNTRLLNPRWLRRHGLLAGDTAEASDHLPVVVDLRIE
jgi:endonuclease/exonuclease/phosphatase family metal-dependent hydrolase